MRRSKIAMKLIPKEKARNAAFHKRKKNLIKKAQELSTLCAVPSCVIIAGAGEVAGATVEAYGFNGGKRCSVREIIERYNAVPEEDKKKRAMSLTHMFDDWKRKAENDLMKIKRKNLAVKYPNWHPKIDFCGKSELIDLLGFLEKKVDLTRKRIAKLKAIQELNSRINSSISSQIMMDGYQFDHLMMQYYNAGNLSSSCSYSCSSSLSSSSLSSMIMPCNMQDWQMALAYDPSSFGTSSMIMPCNMQDWQMVLPCDPSSFGTSYQLGSLGIDGGDFMMQMGGYDSLSAMVGDNVTGISTMKYCSGGEELASMASLQQTPFLPNVHADPRSNSIIGHDELQMNESCVYGYLHLLSN